MCVFVFFSGTSIIFSYFPSVKDSPYLWVLLLNVDVYRAFNLYNKKNYSPNEVKIFM